MGAERNLLSREKREEERERSGRERENGSKRQSARPCLFTGLLTSRWISNTTPGISGAGWSRVESPERFQAILESPKKGYEGERRGTWREKKAKTKLVVKRNIGCNGLWVRLGVCLSVRRNWGERRRGGEGGEGGSVHDSGELQPCCLGGGEDGGRILGHVDQALRGVEAHN